MILLHPFRWRTSRRACQRIQQWTSPQSPVVRRIRQWTEAGR